ncbi:hypothetical protein JCM10212_001459 [Sporobolomyces blumeae]
MSSVPPLKTGPHKRAPPKLDLRAFQAAPTLSVPRRLEPASLVDAHIHLFDQRQLDQREVTWPLASENRQWSSPHGLSEYRTVVQDGGGIERFARGKASFGGIVYVQVEAEHDDDDADGSRGGWDASLSEIDTVCKAALESTVDVIALVPWAPVHHGSAALEKYLARLFALPSLVAYTDQLGYPPVKAFRYLLQDSPKGFFLEDKFIDGLDFLGKRGFAFDLTLDVTHKETGGPLVLDDAVEAIAKVRELQKEGEQTQFILDHFAKPDLTVDSTVPPSAFQTAYIASLFSLALLPNVSLKLSALLDSADEETVKTAFEAYRLGSSVKGKRKGTAYETLMGRILTYLEPAIEAFGDSRILVGSDWPMFRPKLSTEPFSSARIEDEAAAWAFEMQLYLDCLVEIGLEGESLDRIFAGNAKAVYGVLEA